MVDVVIVVLLLRLVGCRRHHYLPPIIIGVYFLLCYHNLNSSCNSNRGSSIRNSLGGILFYVLLVSSS